MKNTYYVMGAAQSDVRKALDEKGVKYETFSKDNDSLYPVGRITFKTDLEMESFRELMPEGFRGAFIFVEKEDYKNWDKTSSMMMNSDSCFYMIKE